MAVQNRRTQHWSVEFSPCGVPALQVHSHTMLSSFFLYNVALGFQSLMIFVLPSSNSVRLLQTLRDVPEQCPRKHRRHRIPNLLLHSRNSPPPRKGMSQRESLQTGQLTTSVWSRPTWMVIIAALAGESLSLCVAVVRGARDPVWRGICVVVCGVLGNVVDHAIDGV
jgi:hypothetical protein